MRGFLFSLCGNDFSASFTRSLGFGSHGALQLHRQTNVLTAKRIAQIVSHYMNRLGI
jgi:hypothetical protein